MYILYFMGEKIKMDSLGIIIVTYNRLEKLKNTLEAYKNQLYKPKYILVIDNNSTDNTNIFLDKWKKEDNINIVYKSPENLGGSGGFCKGMELAMSLDADWIWVADDDAYPKEDCLLNIHNFIKNNISEDEYRLAKVSAVSGTVYCDNEIDTWHRRRFKRKYGIIKEELIDTSEYNSVFTLDLISYVGTAINKNAILNIGYPNKDFFIAYDDSEHSIRLSKLGKIFCLPDAHIIHDAPVEKFGIISWKKYYSMRNKLFSYKKHFGKFQYNVLKVYYLIKNLPNKYLRDMTIKAVKDSNTNRLGLDDIYKPGWKI